MLSSGWIGAASLDAAVVFGFEIGSDELIADLVGDQVDHLVVDLMQLLEKRIEQRTIAEIVDPSRNALRKRINALGTLRR